MKVYEVWNWQRKLHNGGLIVAAALSALYLIGLPMLIKPYWLDICKLFGNDLHLVGLGTWLAHFIQLVTFNCIMGVIYYCQFPFLEQYKVSNKPWPWTVPKQRAEWFKLVRQSIMMVAFNNFVIGLPMGYITAKDVITRHGPSPRRVFSTSLEDFPDTWTLIWQLFVCLLVEDTMFYWLHRMLHIKALYPYIHKWHHKYSYTITIASENAHPLEFFVGNLVPVVVGPMLVGAHTFTYWMWIWLRIMETIDAHCGYSFPWSPVRLLPFGISSEAHDYHHSRNIGCFASQFVWWDWLCGTDHSFQHHQAIINKYASPQELAEADPEEIDQGNYSDETNAGAMAVVPAASAASAKKAA